MKRTRAHSRNSSSTKAPVDRVSSAGAEDGQSLTNRPCQRLRPVVVTFILVVTLALLTESGLIWQNQTKARDVESHAEPQQVPVPMGTLTFAKDIAPIVFAKCAFCHRPGQSAPFSLTSYEDLKKHIGQIADVTARRYMPPWLPEPGFGDFADSRRLSSEQLGIVQQWIREGAIEGDATRVPPLPSWKGGWQLGQPDLVLDLPPYTLAAQGKDVYRNFVFPIPVSATKFVQGVELLPGNLRVVHHAFIDIDETRQSRRLAEKENPPSFEGMDLPESAGMPGGQLLGWQPGKAPSLAEPGLSWVLKANTDLVLQMHLHPSGKPEVVQPKVGLFFTSQAPTNMPFRIRLVRFDFELPAGSNDCLVEQSYVLPVDVDIVRILPHCHYLGKDLQAYAMLPNGEKRWLIWIKAWDFNWQGDYKYAQPVALPKGTRIVMRYSYDNSTNNVRNPNFPPKTVHHGLQTTDEMADLSLQALTHSPKDRALLGADYFKGFLQLSMDSFNFRLRINPDDTDAHLKLGRALEITGQSAEAFSHFNAVLKIRPEDDRAHYELGFLYLRQNRLAEAYGEFQKVIRTNPDDYQAYGNLGLICMAVGRNQDARTYFEAALRLNPDDTMARGNLQRLQTAK